MLWADNVAPVEVADIADNGMRFIGRELPGIGTAVRVLAKGLDERGRVVWRTAHSCGVRLAHRISALAVVRANCFPARFPAGARDARPRWTPSASLTETGWKDMPLGRTADGAGRHAGGTGRYAH